MDRWLWTQGDAIRSLAHVRCIDGWTALTSQNYADLPVNPGGG